MTRCYYCGHRCVGFTCAAHRDIADAEKRWGLLPMGEAYPLHPRDRCALCGSKEAVLTRGVVQSTRAVGLLCLDSSACVRRRSLARKAAA
jgi:hypothetical protein